MSAAHCGSGELDFRLIFEEATAQPLGSTGGTSHLLGCHPGRLPRNTVTDLEPDDSASFYIFNVDQPSSAVSQPICTPWHGHQPHSSACTPTSCFQGFKTFDGPNAVQEQKCNPSGGPKPFECPSIQITSISPNCHQDTETPQELQKGDLENDYVEGPSRDHLHLQLEPSYREPSLSPSPGSSISSRSWFSDASSCESVSHIYDDVESELNEAAARFSLGSPLTSPSGSPRGFPNDDAWQPFCYGASLSPRQSPCHSPRTSITDENWLSPRTTSRPSSRPSSPYGKRRHSSAEICYLSSPHNSPTPSPSHSPRGSVTEDTWIILSHNAANSVSPPQCFQETDIPLKTRKTSEDQSTTLLGKIDLGVEDQGNLSPTLETPSEDSTGSPLPLRKDSFTDQFLSVPSHFTWSKPKSGHTPVFRTSSLPSLDWPLPSHYGQCELKVEVQPKTHHRAHYETEGSRGAVKAATGGHPVVKLLGYTEKTVNLQMFIGTADDRYLRPHAFYQVHRITGKTVATASQEIVIASTKVLEIPLLPENNMCASIDCAGILKLRNSDIELRKGETDIGRKNTRVRLVFRAHIPQPNGKVLSLQTASIPIECSQRSAQELPQVDKYSINTCSVTGGAEMIIAGSNILPESKVIFIEKGQDGRPQWEAEAKILTERRDLAEVVVEIPPYHNKSIVATVQVQFHLCNGKRKRSQSQRFNYTPALQKEKCTKENDLPAVSDTSLHHVVSVSGQQVLHSDRPCSGQRYNHENITCSLEQAFGCSSQTVYSTLMNQRVPDPSQGRNINGRSEFLSSTVQQFCPLSASATRSSYASMQSNVLHNGQSSLPLHLAPAQEYDPLHFQQEIGIPRQLSLSQSMAIAEFHASTTIPTSSFPSITEPLIHVMQSPQLQQISYHCQNTEQNTITSNQFSGHPPSQLTSVSHNLTKPGPTSSPTSAALSSLTHSPMSSSSSPQLPKMPFKSAASSVAASSPSLNPMAHSGQLPAQTDRVGLSRLSYLPTHGHQEIQESSSFHPDDSFSEAPEDGELGFQTIGLQDITLDDVKMIKQRWKTLRDNFKRELTRQQQIRSGSSGKHGRMYCHYYELEFLKPVMQDRQTESNINSESEAEELTPENTTIEPHVTEEENDEEDIRETPLEPPRKSTSKSKSKKPQKIQEVIDVVRNLIDSQKTENNKISAFTKSLIPQIALVKQEYQCDLRIELMKVIKSFQQKSNTQTSENPQQYLHYGNPWFNYGLRINAWNHNIAYLSVIIKRSHGDIATLQLVSLLNNTGVSKSRR
ncbi:nuclear factor of activated T-cells, cytoplasmic 3 isoform X2 [Aquarana catesbeiana]|uniref:nuclear factor of activated T-cells, cytoplasmic 3 isoform X2 n=1 Tax=Aquarana catesbeiana TaxID=8400 RepID=UPI003CCA5F15